MRVLLSSFDMCVFQVCKLISVIINIKMIIFITYAINLFIKKSQANKFRINFILILREIKKST